MSDRLTDLQRQRALAQEQLAWFDREIAKETGQAPAAPLPVAPPPAAAPVAPAASPTAEEILARYQRPGQAPDKEVKRGCYLYFVLALVLLVILVASAYYLYVSFRN